MSNFSLNNFLKKKISPNPQTVCSTSRFCRRTWRECCVKKQLLLICTVAALFPAGWRQILCNRSKLIPTATVHSSHYDLKYLHSAVSANAEHACVLLFMFFNARYVRITAGCAGLIWITTVIYGVPFKVACILCLRLVMAENISYSQVLLSHQFKPFYFQEVQGQVSIRLRYSI